MIDSRSGLMSDSEIEPVSDSRLEPLVGSMLKGLNRDWSFTGVVTVVLLMI